MRKPYLLRLDPEMMGQLDIMTWATGKSKNAIISDAVKEHLDQRGVRLAAGGRLEMIVIADEASKMWEHPIPEYPETEGRMFTVETPPEEITFTSLAPTEPAPNTTVPFEQEI